MKRSALLLILLTAGSLCADVTLRYKTAFKSPFLAAMPADALSEIQSIIPSSTTTRVKGAKGVSDIGWMQAIMDIGAHQVTLIDSKGKAYAVASNDEYSKTMSGSVPEMPEAVRTILASLKTKTDNKLTGRVATIQGIEAEEREITTTIEGSPMPGMPNINIRTVMQIWMAKPSEVERVPALKELAAFNAANFSSLNPTGAFQKLFTMLPGDGGGVGPLMSEVLKKNAVVMRMSLDLYMPMLADLAKMSPAGNSLPAFDPEAPLFQLNQEMVELSADAIPDNVFEIPAGYQKQPADEFMKALVARLTPTK